MLQHRIVIVDDHPLLRAGIRTAISAHADLTVVGEASDARTGIEIIESTRPDVAVLDVSLPGSDGIALGRQIVRSLPKTRVLMLSMHKGADYVRQALAAGAAGYLLKDDPPSAIPDAIRAVMAGDLYLSTQLRENVVQGEQGGSLEALSSREREIFSLIVHGHSSQSIAKELCISIKTVETHRAHINRKLGVHSTGQIVRLAAQRGLLPQ